MDKKEIRKTISTIRDSIDKDKKDLMDREIITRFLNLEEYKNAKNICIYVSYKSEINTKKIIETALKDNKNIYVPRTKEKGVMEFIKIESLENLEKNHMGILEPKNDLNEKVEEIDINVLPGLAFDMQGGRVGYGGGYYDRYFIGYKCLNISLCYEVQIINKAPMDKHDILYDYLISEKRTIKI